MVDDVFVEAVEDECRTSSNAWDRIKPEEICEAVIKVYHQRLRERVIDRENMSDLDREYQEIIANS